MQKRLTIIVLVAVSLFLAGCSALAVQPEETTAPSATKSFERTSNSFTLTLEDAKSDNYKHVADTLRSSGRIQEYVAYLNTQVTLDKQVPITFKECNEQAAYYDFARKDITICYEAIDRWETLFARKYNDRAQTQEALVGATVFILAHESGHATMDINDIPFTGKEEDAADQFATYMLTRESDFGEQAALYGGEIFLLQGEDEGQLPLWGEHSLDEQR